MAPLYRGVNLENNPAALMIIGGNWIFRTEARLVAFGLTIEAQGGWLVKYKKNEVKKGRIANQ